MKVRIEPTDGTTEDEVIIRCRHAESETVQRIYRYALEQAEAGASLTFYKENREYYFPLENVLFFETEGEHIYAHTADDAFLIKYRLYELERMLPQFFVRASKSTIGNVRKVFSVTRSLTSSSLVQFTESHKQVYVSRYYYRDLRQKLQERSLL